MDPELEKLLCPPPPTETTTRAEFRIAERERHKELSKKLPQARKDGTLASYRDNMEIIDVVVQPSDVDMETLIGSDEFKEDKIEELYHNCGCFLRPGQRLPPSFQDRIGKDLAQNAQGIYYYHHHKKRFTTLDRHVWVPSLEGIKWDDPGEVDRRRRAKILAKHARDNETWKKSEYAWEADAWSDVFGEMRDDPYLTMDKRKYYTKYQSTHELLCTLTGGSELIKRVPDATFGLATFPDRSSPVFVEELHKDSLEKLLLHPKCGLLADPAWGQTDLAFPFAVYEAKGWDGDCREARRQACAAAAVYLDLLDNLARTPGPMESYGKRKYQTPKSHRYQVFALTSFGAHWHLLVGHRRPRVDNSATSGLNWWDQEPNHHADKDGMSENIYVFQRIWSGRVTDEFKAWKLLSFVDQIKNWAQSEHRSFVIEHLKPWKHFVDQNFLLDWQSIYDRGKKWSRFETDDLRLPLWTTNMSRFEVERLQVKSKLAVANARRVASRHKGKSRIDSGTGEDDGIRCNVGECEQLDKKDPRNCIGSLEAFLDHLQTVHGYAGVDLARIRETVREHYDTEEQIEQPDINYSDETTVGSALSGARRWMEVYEARQRKKMADSEAAEHKRAIEPTDDTRSRKRRKTTMQDQDEDGLSE